MDKVQLIFFYIAGFLVSRLIIKTLLPQRIVYSFIGEKHLSFSRIVFNLIAISALLSFFIPNVLTVLTLIPILELLRQSYEKSTPQSGSFATMLALSTIYGANIGGMGSITATPANGILAAFVEAQDVAGKAELTFASWLVWGIPLVICFVFLAWFILVAVFRPSRFEGTKIELPFSEKEVYHPQQKRTVVITSIFFILSLLLSVLMMQFPQYGIPILIITALFTLLLFAALFVFKINMSDNSDEKAPLLVLADCYSNLPTKGFVFVGIAVALAGVVYLFDLDSVLGDWISAFMPADPSSHSFFFAIALFTSFATEIFSNTAVQLSLFVIAVPTAEALGISSLTALIIITLSSTSAFMSPIATGVNGLAFGGVKHVSFTKMLIVGFIMNIAGAALLSIWVVYVIDWLYHAV